MSTEAKSYLDESSRSSFAAKHPLWYALLATAVFVAIVALIAAQPQQPDAIDYLAGNALP